MNSRSLAHVSGAGFSSFAVWLFCLLLTSCTSPPTPAHEFHPNFEQKILIVGIDAAAWNVALPLMRQGKLPRFSAWRSQGISATLETFKPTESLQIWTSAVTGKMPEKHGMKSWLRENSRDLAISSNLRKVESLWTLLPKTGLSTAFVHWWGSWPAEPTKGWLLSSQFFSAQDPRDSYPPSLREDYRPWLPGPLFRGTYDPEVIEKALNIPEDLLDLNAASPAVRQNLITLSNWLRLDLATGAAGKYLLEKYSVNVAGVFLRGLDLIEHMFWRFQEPKGFRVKAEDLASFQSVVTRYYRLKETLADQLIQAVSEETLVIILSDHGMYSRLRNQPVVQGPQIWKGGKSTIIVEDYGVHLEKPPGILLAFGPGVRRGVTLEPESILDLTPTVLAAVNLPMARDMDGKARLEWFEERRLRLIPEIDTYESLTEEDPGPTPIPSDLDEQLKEELKGLGYFK